MCGGKKAVMVSLIEGVELNTCEDCGKFGKRVKVLVGQKQAIVHQARQMARPRENEKIVIMVPGYAKMIKQAREKMGLKQEDVAKKISEKESLLHNIESGHHEPDVELAKKLGRFFHIKIIDEIEDKGDPQEQGKSPGSLTVGDLINIKKR
jgi:putative transcription factor